MIKAYDFYCPDGHTTEHFLKEFTQKVECGHVDVDGVCCTKEGEYSPSFWYSSSADAEKRFQAAQRFKPVVIHRDAEGNIRYPGHSEAPVPEGFMKVELADINQVRAFEREVNAKDQLKAEKFRHARSEFVSGQLAENRRVMDGLVQNFTPRGRKFHDKMREVSERRRLAGARQVQPEFVIEAFSQDASNREGYRDARNDWGRMHGNGK